MDTSKALNLLGPYTHSKTGVVLGNRVLVAPMTRGRSGPTRVPNDDNVLYYTQRASAGMIITEGTTFNDSSQGWVGNAAIWTDEQVAGWKKVIDSVHAAGGLMCCQVWHLGRASYPNFHEDNADPIGPSAIAADFEGHDAEEKKLKFPVPRAIEASEIPGLIADYAKAAENCKAAGFDFIELHGANGYLIDEFLQSCSNKRTDEYGGSLENRFRFLKEVLEASATKFDRHRIGVRLGPNANFNGMGSIDNIEAFSYYAKQLNDMDIGFLHVVDGLTFGFHGLSRPMNLVDFRKVFDGTLIGNCGYTRDQAEGAIKSGAADLISFGRDYINNPDLVERFANDWPLSTRFEPQTWFTHGLDGYIDYPAYTEQKN